MILSGNSGLNGLRDDKIQLISCPHNCRNCKLILSDINCRFNDSEQYQSSKEYHLSILSLKEAYQRTYEIGERVEQGCARLFRLTIIESLENIRQDLKRMTNSFFCKNHHKENYLLAEKTLDEFKQLATAVKQSNMQHSSASHEFEELNLPAV